MVSDHLMLEWLKVPSHEATCCTTCGATRHTFITYTPVWPRDQTGATIMNRQIEPYDGSI